MIGLNPTALTTTTVVHNTYDLGHGWRLTETITQANPSDETTWEYTYAVDAPLPPLQPLTNTGPFPEPDFRTNP